MSTSAKAVIVNVAVKADSRRRRSIVRCEVSSSRYLAVLAPRSRMWARRKSPLSAAAAQEGSSAARSNRTTFARPAATTETSEGATAART